MSLKSAMALARFRVSSIGRTRNLELRWLLVWSPDLASPPQLTRSLVL
jgi:hypothetical protein